MQIMYKQKRFENISEMLKWLNASSIEPSDIISIVPSQVNIPFEENSLCRKFEIIYTAGRYQNIDRKVPVTDVKSMIVAQVAEEELELLRKEVAQNAVVINNLQNGIIKERAARTAAERREQILKERSWWERLFRKGE